MAENRSTEPTPKTDEPSTSVPSAVRLAIAGFAATLVGIGLSRFAYTPLIPVVVEAGWFEAGDAALLGASNLAGYLIGAWSARWVAGRIDSVLVVRVLMIAVAASFFACATVLPFTWFFAWRLVSGLAGGALMILGPSLVLSTVPAARRGLAGGVVFAGVGAGILLSAMAVPPLTAFDPGVAWIAIGGLCALVTLVAWPLWPKEEHRSADVPAPGAEPSAGEGPRLTLPLFSVYVGYGLAAVGLVAHMVFLVDYVARGLGWGVGAGGFYWGLFGLGACLGPVMAGAIADRIGFRAAFRGALVIEAVGVGLLIVEPGAVVLGVSSFIVGGIVPGIVPLALGRSRELVTTSEAARRAAWSTATTAFAVGQAGAGYAFSLVFAATGDYHLLFALGTGAMAVAVLVDVVASRPGRSVAD